MLHRVILSLGVALFVFGAASAKADIGIIHGDGSTAVAYVSNGQVYYETCPQKRPPLKRGCSGKENGSFFSAPLEVYARGVQSFFGLVDRRFGGVKGPKELDAQIEDLKTQVDDVDLSLKELNRAQAQLRTWVHLRDMADEAERKILSHLEADHDMVFSSRVQSERVDIVINAFYGVAYFGPGHVLYRLTNPVEWNGAEAGCQANGKDWHPVYDFTSELREHLAKSAVSFIEGSNVVWTNSVKPPRYYLSCSCERTYAAPLSNASEITAEQWDDAQRRHFYGSAEQAACYNVFGGCYVLTQTVTASVSYLERQLQVVDLTASEPVSTPLNIPDNASVPHRALCKSDFSPGDLLAPASDASVDFSLYEIDRGLQTLAHLVYKNRADFYRELAKTLANYPLRSQDDLALGFRNAQARLLALNVIDPLLQDTQTSRVQDDIIPAYQKAVHEWNAKLKIDTLPQIELTPATYRVALTILTASLQATHNFLTPADVTLADQATVVLGKSLAQGPSGLKAFLEAWKPFAELPDHLRQNARTRGFGMMMGSVVAYLQSK